LQKAGAPARGNLGKGSAVDRGGKTLQSPINIQTKNVRGTLWQSYGGAPVPKGWWGKPQHGTGDRIVVGRGPRIYCNIGPFLRPGGGARLTTCGGRGGGPEPRCWPPVWGPRGGPEGCWGGHENPQGKGDGRMGNKNNRGPLVGGLGQGGVVRSLGRANPRGGGWGHLFAGAGGGGVGIGGGSTGWGGLGRRALGGTGNESVETLGVGGWAPWCGLENNRGPLHAVCLGGTGAGPRPPAPRGFCLSPLAVVVSVFFPPRVGGGEQGRGGPRGAFFWSPTRRVGGTTCGSRGVLGPGKTGFCEIGILKAQHPIVKFIFTRGGEGGKNGRGGAPGLEHAFWGGTGWGRDGV